MKRGGAKRKGNGYEIKIARIFSEWYLNNFTKEANSIARRDDAVEEYDYFWRTAGSGAKATVTRRGETSFCGDITFLPNPDRLQLWIDCKDRREATFNNILTGNFIIEKWYNEEVKKRDKLGIKKPVVIIFKLYKKKENYIYYNCRELFVGIKKVDYILCRDFAIFHLEDFLRHIKKERVLKL